MTPSLALSLRWRCYLRAGCQKWSDSSSHELLLPPLRVWDGWLAHGDSRLEIRTGDSVRGQRRTITGTAATHRECQSALTSALWIKGSLSLFSRLWISGLAMNGAPSPGLIVGCVSIMMSGEMMMNWVRETKTATITPPMVTRHDSYSVISISPGKLLSTSVVFTKPLLPTWPPLVITSAHILLVWVVIVCPNC